MYYIKLIKFVFILLSLFISLFLFNFFLYFIILFIFYLEELIFFMVKNKFQSLLENQTSFVTVTKTNTHFLYPKISFMLNKKIL